MSGGITAGEKISRASLENEARDSTLRGHGTPEERFWLRQRGQEETIAVGRQYIEKVNLPYPLRLVNVVCIEDWD